MWVNVYVWDRQLCYYSYHCVTIDECIILYLVGWHSLPCTNKQCLCGHAPAVVCKWLRDPLRVRGIYLISEDYSMYVCKYILYVFSLLECIYPPCMYGIVIYLDLFLSIGFFASLYAALPHVHWKIARLGLQCDKCFECQYVCLYVCMHIYIWIRMYVCVYISKRYLKVFLLQAYEFGLLYRVRSSWSWPGPWAPVIGHRIWRIGTTSMLGGSYVLHDALTCPWWAAFRTVIGWWGYDSRPANDVAMQRRDLLWNRGRPWPHQGWPLYAKVCIVLCMYVCK